LLGFGGNCASSSGRALRTVQGFMNHLAAHMPPLHKALTTIPAETTNHLKPSLVSTGGATGLFWLTLNKL
jgi:hypothetical protein